MTILSAAITLVLVMDPLGNIPVFLSLLSHVEKRRRPKVLIREMIIALGILVVFLFFGRYILSALHIGEPALSIGGGVVLFLIALRMMFPSHRDTTAEYHGEEPLIVPLAVPLVAGPSAMATVILLATQDPDRMGAWLLALVIAWLVSAIVLLFAEALRRYLGRRLINALERLMGMILTTLAIQMLLTGIKSFAGSLPG
jgi:multiple antibiotic resistance protein